jgi:hypothetical protein
MTVLVALAFLLAPAPPLQKEGKVRFFVTAPENSVSHGVQQRASELEDSASDLKRRLRKTKWTELAETREEADVEFRVLGRRFEPERGYVLHYSMDAGAYKTEDEFAYQSESFSDGRAPVTTHHGGGAAAGARTVLRWEELHKRLAESLEKFAESNYERIVSQRAPSR